MKSHLTQPHGIVPAPRGRHRTEAFAVAALVVLLVSNGATQDQDAFRFRTGVELINVTATVTDSSGRFVPGLQKSDFTVYDDDQRVEITHFSAERVPVSLGIIVDTSASMMGPKIAAARAALDRLLFDLLDPQDEIFLYRFANRPRLVQGWTTDRSQISAELRRLNPDGGTALYDAVAEALPLLNSGRHRKKALLVISDGNDTSSHTDLATLKRLIRESEALVYAIGMDAPATLTTIGGNRPGGSKIWEQRRGPVPRPFPIPGRGIPPRNPPVPGIPPTTPRTPPGPIPDDPPARPMPPPGSERVNVAALRDITDDSGGRTEILRDPRDLDVTTARVADELSKQYYIGYPSPRHGDGHWHTIRVEVRDGSLRVRARRGYIAAS
jgi:Ca-activated chloride channel homolog